MENKVLLKNLVDFTLKLYVGLSLVFVPLVHLNIINATINGIQFSGIKGIVYTLLILAVSCTWLPIALFVEIKMKSHD